MMSEGDESAGPPAPIEDVARQSLEIQRVLMQYAFTVDAGDAEGWLECFVPDATIRTELEPGIVVPAFTPSKIAGEQQLRRAARFIARSRVEHLLPVQTHFIGNTVIDVVDAKAHSVSYFVRLDHYEGSTRIGSSGRYDDDWEHSEDRGWRIRTRLILLRAWLPPDMI